MTLDYPELFTRRVRVWQRVRLEEPGLYRVTLYARTDRDGYVHDLKVIYARRARELQPLRFVLRGVPIHAKGDIRRVRVRPRKKIQTPRGLERLYPFTISFLPLDPLAPFPAGGFVLVQGRALRGRLVGRPVPSLTNRLLPPG